MWALVTPRRQSRHKFKNIEVCSVYYRGPKSTKKQELYDHIAETFNYLSSKYGSNIQFIIAGDTNRLNLSTILNLSSNLKQVVKTFTRLKPEAILDPIITTLWKYYQEPVTKPPINSDLNSKGKPSGCWYSSPRLRIPPTSLVPAILDPNFFPLLLKSLYIIHAFLSFTPDNFFPCYFCPVPFSFDYSPLYNFFHF